MTETVSRRHVLLGCLLSLVIISTALSQPVAARSTQTTPVAPPPLSETFTNINVAFNYPAGWVAMELAPRYIVIADTQAVMDSRPIGGDPNGLGRQAGEVLIQMQYTARDEAIPGNTDDPLVALNAYRQEAQPGLTIGVPTAVELGRKLFGQSPLTFETARAEGFYYGFILDGRFGVVSVVTAIGEYEQQRPIIEGILASLTFGVAPEVATPVSTLPAYVPPTFAPTEVAITPTSAPSLTPTVAENTAGDSRTASVIRQWASEATATSQYGDDSWSAAQATGEPDTDTCGDNRTAWASQSPTGQDSLTLHFDQAVTPTQINIYETYSPGAIISVQLLPVDGSPAIEIPNSFDPGTECPGVFTLDLDLDDVKPINGVKINLDQRNTMAWNEIDAVELVGITRSNIAIEPSVTPAPTNTSDPNALRQWASEASATSQYGDDSWSASQATGEPDTTTCDDNRSAWASLYPNGQDSLTLHYDQAVFPTQINIYQTYTPGQIVSVELLPADGSAAIIIPNSKDPGTACPGVFSLALALDDIKPINGVRLNLDQTIYNGWNEIDAVELVGRPSR